jgi:hypothetical protein
MPGLARALLAVLALATLCAAARADAPDAQRVREAEFVFARSGLTPPEGLPWQPISLPDRWKVSWAGITGNVWYRARFEVARPGAEPWTVYLPRLREGGALFVNDQLLARVREPDPGTWVRWMRPHAFAIPPSLLRAGGTLHVRINPASATVSSAHHIRPEASCARATSRATSSPTRWRRSSAP